MGADVWSLLLTPSESDDRSRARYARGTKGARCRRGKRMKKLIGAISATFVYPAPRSRPYHGSHSYCEGAAVLGVDTEFGIPLGNYSDATASVTARLHR